jgi:hypothetical protein
MLMNFVLESIKKEEEEERKKKEERNILDFNSTLTLVHSYLYIFKNLSIDV